MPRPRFGQFLDPAVQVADARPGCDDDLAVEVDDRLVYPMHRGVLRTHADRDDLAVAGDVLARAALALAQLFDGEAYRTRDDVMALVFVAVARHQISPFRSRRIRPPDG
ncbi:MAG: hypothetical protein M1337_01205, partial [Actinobacteria bacterium]|nr:hypothetical protein [Actinomycetota bacterium]